ncbi:hypothetical protein [Alistipes communis]|uniref:hypothetical protein n=1 Tax=Alistipes communis TaxID=2585118 RepID=UPI0029428A0A|nr:hypothetical protein [Alistipes communis]
MAGRTSAICSRELSRSHFLVGAEKPTCTSKTTWGPCEGLPFFVVTMMTPFDARAP